MLSQLWGAAAALPHDGGRYGWGKFTTMAKPSATRFGIVRRGKRWSRDRTHHGALLREEKTAWRFPLIRAARAGTREAIGAAVLAALVALPGASGSSTSQPQASRQLTAAIAR